MGPSVPRRAGGRRDCRCSSKAAAKLSDGRLLVLVADAPAACDIVAFVPHLASLFASADDLLVDAVAQPPWCVDPASQDVAEAFRVADKQGFDLLPVRESGGELRRTVWNAAPASAKVQPEARAQRMLVRTTMPTKAARRVTFPASWPMAADGAKRPRCRLLPCCRALLLTDSRSHEPRRRVGCCFPCKGASVWGRGRGFRRRRATIAFMFFGAAKLVIALATRRSFQQRGQADLDVERETLRGLAGLDDRAHAREHVSALRLWQPNDPAY
jgi:hypothetical protein